MAVQERGHAERLPEGQLYHPNGGAVKRESTRAHARLLPRGQSPYMGAMATVTLDTHRIVKRLKDAGFTDAQAETVTDIIAETRATDLADIATRADLVPLATKADVAELETKIIKWLVPLLLGQTGLIVALIKLLP
jgi:hypothetical protein